MDRCQSGCSNSRMCIGYIDHSLCRYQIYHMFLEKQGAYSIVTGIKADGSTREN